MKRLILTIAAAATIGMPMTIAAPAFAQPGPDYGWHGDRGDWRPEDSYRPGRYRARRMNRDDQIYGGRDGRYYCRRNDGTTGTIIGAVGGGLAGNLLGGGTLGTLLGAGGGALLGRSVDRGKVKCR